MRTVLVSTVISLAASGAVMAADVAAKAPLAPQPSAYDWTGVYFGGHIGGGWQSTDVSDPSSHSIIETFSCFIACDGGNLISGPQTQTIRSTSFLGGVQVGANYQIGRLVLGSEVDFSWTGLNGTNSAIWAVSTLNNASNIETVSADTNWMGTATTRLGVARNNWLLYGKGGAAWAHTTYTLTNIGGSPTFPPHWNYTSTTSDTRLGWTLGVGVEWAFARNWTAKLEYDYLNFGSKPETFSGVYTGLVGPSPTVPANTATNIFQQISQVKLGINYKLDPGFLFW